MPTNTVSSTRADDMKSKVLFSGLKWDRNQMRGGTERSAAWGIIPITVMPRVPGRPRGRRKSCSLPAPRQRGERGRMLAKRMVEVMDGDGGSDR